MTKLTNAQLAALLRVDAGSVTRRYTMRGNRFSCCARTMAELEAAGLIQDEQGYRGGAYVAFANVILTETGRSELAQAQNKDGRSCR